MYLKYLWQVLRHKWFVFWEACHLGVPWLGLIHDLSKFRPDEFIPYARYFYGKRRLEDIPGDMMACIAGLDKDSVDRAFDLAWNRHQKRNKHHWQWWVLIYDHPERTPEVLIEIPERYRREMLADWLGAGRAYGNPDLIGWYREHRPHMRMEKTTRDSMDVMVGFKP